MAVAAGLSVTSLATVANTSITVYENDFQGDIVGSEWTSDSPYSWGTTETVSTTDGDRQFLGYFGGNNIATLTLTGLPADVISLQLEFDAYVLWSWDGNDIRTMNGVMVGPDVFGFQYGNGTAPGARNEWTFSHGDPATQPQSYCEGAGSSCAPTTGAEERYTLGYRFQIDPMDADLASTTNAPMDSVYRMAWEGVHTGNTASFSFYSRGLQVRPDLSFAYLDEAWGLDNVRVTAVLAAPIPEPSTWVSMLAGAAVMAGWSWKRRTARRS
jgi:hypothetical protein